MEILDGARAAGLDPDRLRRAFALAQEWIDQGVLPGAAALVTRGGVVAGEAYLGLADSRSGRPVDERTVWSLASVTKPFTAAAVLQLVEDGLLSLDEPLHRLLPEFMEAPQTAFDRREVTLRHALSHCSGLPGFSEDNIALRKEHRPLAEFIRSFARQPLFFAPGEAHLYSNCAIGLAAEAAGRALDGSLRRAVQSPAVNHYHPFMRDRILRPLGMRDTAMHPESAWDERIAWVERTGQEGTDYEGANSRYYRELGIPWGGLFSTPRDLVRFVDVFLPQAAGRQRVGLEPGQQTGDAAPRIVSAATAALMTRAQWSPPDAPADVAAAQRDAAAPKLLRGAVPWGIGWDVKGGKRSHTSGDLTSPDTYGHTGATGTMVWADPAVDVACVLLTNRTAASGWNADVPRRALFSSAVMAAVL
jgi:beta-lactamase class C